MSLALQGGFLTTGLPGNLSCKKDLTAAVSLGFDSYWINLESKEDKIKILRHTSFCITSSRFIYLSSTDSNLFLFTAEEHSIVGFPGDSVVKNLPATHCRRHRSCSFDPWVSKIPWRGKWQPTPVFLPGKSHGQRSLAGYSPRGHKESDTAE